MRKTDKKTNNIIEITDFFSPELDAYARLSENQLLNRAEPENGTQEVMDVLKLCHEVPVYTAEFDVLTRLTGFALTRGMLCAMYRHPLPSVEEICRDARRIAVLEEVVNPTNVGAIFRSAAALNMDAVILTAGCSNPLYRRAIRVSMGTVFQIPWTILDKKMAWPQEGMGILKAAASAVAFWELGRRRS